MLFCLQLVHHRIIQYCLTGLLDPPTEIALMDFLDCLTQLCTERVDLTKWNSYVEEINEALVVFERHFPMLMVTILVPPPQWCVRDEWQFWPVLRRNLRVIYSLTLIARLIFASIILNDADRILNFFVIYVVGVINYYYNYVTSLSPLNLSSTNF